MASSSITIPEWGTIGRPGWWHQLAVRIRSVLGLAMGLGLWPGAAFHWTMLAGWVVLLGGPG